MTSFSLFTISKHFFLCNSIRHHFFHISWSRNWNTGTVKTKSVHCLFVPFSWHVFFFFPPSVILSVFLQVWSQNLRLFTEKSGDVMFMENFHLWIWLQVGIFSRGRDRALRTEKLTALVLWSFFFFFLTFPWLIHIKPFKLCKRWGRKLQGIASLTTQPDIHRESVCDHVMKDKIITHMVKALNYISMCKLNSPLT